MTIPRAAIAGLMVLSACASSAAKAPKPAAVVALPAAKPEARVHFDEGLRLMEDPAAATQAIAAFERATAADPKLFEAFHDRGVVEARIGRHDSAIKSFERALKVQPGSPRTVRALAEVYLRARRPGDAVELLQDRMSAPPVDGAASDPEGDELRLLFVQALRESGKTSRALQEVEILLSRAGRNARAFNALGLIYYRMERAALAETAFRRALELDPKSAEVWNNLGLVALQRGRDRDAFEAFDKAAALDASFAEARFNKAGVLLDCGDYARALTELESAARARPNDPDLLVALGVAARGAGKPEEARRAYESALAVAPGFPPAHFNLGILYMDFLPDKAKAREHLQVYRKVAPSGDPRQKETEMRLKELK
ncbi:MAG TPA: tetratricopeptide repeat protein [Polyangia bacterium]